MIKIVKNPTKKEVSIFEKFAHNNWGEHSTDGDQALDFFDTHRIIYENYQENKLVSGLVVFFKTLVFSDRIYNIAGIGGVVTHKDFRNKGYAQATLKFVLQNLKTMKLDAVLLCTEIDKLGVFYNKVGFAPLNKPYYFIDKLGNKKSEKGGMIADLGNKSAYNFILTTKEELFVGLSNF